jgi:nitroimidazol reductase NimA-like FMN-containing flavoprotein (pyridoxamine 5'-phosphate oxidase superfamily)
VAFQPRAYGNRMSEFKPTERTQVRRLPNRGAYDSETIFKILDEGLICHVGFSLDGQPFVIPTGYARVAHTLYIHGSAASRMLRTLAEGVQVCVTVTLLDGLVLARAAFRHSMNYRSVVILGRGTLVEDRAEKIRALEAFTEHIVRGRWNDVRLPTESELKATTVLALPLSEVSAKIRTGPPKDDEEDYNLPIWAGVVPLPIVPSAPIPDPRLVSGLKAPAYAKKYSRDVQPG